MTRVEIRVKPTDLAHWKASAKQNGLTLAEYVRRRVNGRPLKAVKKRKPIEEPVEPPCIHGVSWDEECEYCEAEEKADLEAWDQRQAKEQAERERRQEAERLAEASGGRLDGSQRCQRRTGNDGATWRRSW
jgi:hypothetical protein